MSARDETCGKGAGPLRRGIPVVLRSAISVKVGEGSQDVCGGFVSRGTTTSRVA